MADHYRCSWRLFYHFDMIQIGYFEPESAREE